MWIHTDLLLSDRQGLVQRIYTNIYIHTCTHTSTHWFIKALAMPMLLSVWKWSQVPDGIAKPQCQGKRVTWRVRLPHPHNPFRPCSATRWVGCLLCSASSSLPPSYSSLPSLSVSLSQSIYILLQRSSKHKLKNKIVYFFISWSVRKNQVSVCHPL